MFRKILVIFMLVLFFTQPLQVLADDLTTVTVDEALSTSTYYIAGENEIILDVEGALAKSPSITEKEIELVQEYLEKISDRQIDEILLDNDYDLENVKIDSEMAYANFGNIFFVVLDAIADGLYKAAEFLIIDDIKTLFNPNASGFDKALAAAGFFPVGKIIKGGKMILKFTNKSGQSAERIVKNTTQNNQLADKAISTAQTTKKPIVLYDPKFAAQQLLNGGKIHINMLEKMVPNGAVNGFRPSATIADGYKYHYTVNGTKIEIKWHSPDSNAAIKYPGSNSGKNWTAQITIGNKLLGQDGKFYKKANDLTHIPVEGIQK